MVMVITERNIATITHDKGFPNPVWVYFLPGGQTLASVSRHVVQFWDVVTERNIANLDFFTGSNLPVCNQLCGPFHLMEKLWHPQKTVEKSSFGM